VLAIVRERYSDFGPTLAAESCPSCMAWSCVDTAAMDDRAGLWVQRKDRLKRVINRGARRDCLGELVQIEWLRALVVRGPWSAIHPARLCDDATSRLMHLKFVETEIDLRLLQATREYLEAHGKRSRSYSDKHGVFRVNSAAQSGDGMTQFGRSLHRPQHRLLCAKRRRQKAV